MYLPTAFAERNLSKLHEFIEQNSFGLVISYAEGQPVASHLPLLLDRTAGAKGALIGHMARANHQWRQAAGQEVLAIFSGPHTYISPTWYQAEQVVPTWNYVAVHAYGRLMLIQEPDALLKIVGDLVHAYERSLPEPWLLDGWEDFVQRKLEQIVGFRIALERIEGKWKLSQNHPVEPRRRVIQALKNHGDENSIAIAALMEETLGQE
jgi:transcriptional regulator